MIAADEIEGNGPAVNPRTVPDALESKFFYALQHDVELMIEIAKASALAAAKEEGRRVARALVTPKEPQARRREIQRAYEERRRAAGRTAVSASGEI